MVVVLAVALAVVGAVVVGPIVNHLVLWWIGWRVVLPQMTGAVASRAELGRVRVACAECGAPLARPVLPVPSFSVAAVRGK